MSSLAAVPAIGTKFSENPFGNQHSPRFVVLAHATPAIVAINCIASIGKVQRNASRNFPTVSAKFLSLRSEKVPIFATILHRPCAIKFPTMRDVHPMEHTKEMNV